MSIKDRKQRHYSPKSIRETLPISTDLPVNDAFVQLKTLLIKSSNSPIPIQQSKPEAEKALKSLLSVNSPKAANKESNPEALLALKTMLSSKKIVEVDNSVETSTNSSVTDKKQIANDNIKKTPKKKRNKSPGSNDQVYFASSSFQNSPDPLAVPLPDFDEIQSSFFFESIPIEPQTITPSTSPVDNNQIDSLRRLLKIPA
jgi:hypothetical protein